MVEKFEVWANMLERVWREYGNGKTKDAMKFAIAYANAYPITAFGSYDSHEARKILNALREIAPSAGFKCDAKVADIVKILEALHEEDPQTGWLIINDSSYFFVQREIEDREHIRSTLKSIGRQRDLAPHLKRQVSDLLAHMRKNEQRS